MYADIIDYFRRVRSEPKWNDYPVIIEGVPGFCALRVPAGTDIELVKKAVLQLAPPKARFHG